MKKLKDKKMGIRRSGGDPTSRIPEVGSRGKRDRAFKKKPKIFRVGGMALTSGVMMRSQHFIAVAFDNGQDIMLAEGKLKAARVKYKWTAWPFIRGIALLIDSFIAAQVSFKFLNRFVKKQPISKKAKRSYDCVTFIFYFAVIFMIMDYLTYLISQLDIFYFHPVLYNLFESLIFILFFTAIINLVYEFGSEHKLLSYHGAEHKTINAYEHGAKMIPEEIKKYSRLHPRCGSIVAGHTIIIASIISSLLVFEMNGFLYLLLNIALVFMAFSLAYELTLLLISTYRNPISRTLLLPALGFQAIMTREPNERQIAVALTALADVIKREEEENGKR